MERIYNECNKIADMVMALEETITEEEGIKFKEALTELGYARLGVLPTERQKCRWKLSYHKTENAKRVYAKKRTRAIWEKAPRRNGKRIRERDRKAIT